MSLIKMYGRMWARTEANIDTVTKRTGDKDVAGVYVLYDGSMPVYIGMGNLRKRIQAAKKSERRGQLWDHFSWYIPSNPAHMREIEALLLNILPFYIRFLNRQLGTIPGKEPRPNKKRGPEAITRRKLPPK
jgi:hypothetical protein